MTISQFSFLKVTQSIQKVSLKTCWLKIPLKLLFLSIILITFIGCNSNEEVESIFFHASVSDIKAYSATVTVTHNATNRDSYYGFAVEGSASDIKAEISKYLSSTNKKELAESVRHQRKSVFQIKGLSPETIFTYIVFGMNDNGDLYGEPSSVVFKTAQSDIIATENPNWKIKYMGHTVYNNNDYSLITVSLLGDVEERFFLATYSADFTNSFKHTENLIDYAIREFIKKNETEEEYWLETSEVRTGGTRFYRYLQEGDYVSYAIGINADGSATGHYVKTDKYHVDKYPMINILWRMPTPTSLGNG